MQATIQNEFLSLTVDTHGAEAVSLKNAAGEELLWQADPAAWKRHAPILFPWTGKLKDGSFTHGGKTYKGGQHGFARDVEHTLLKAGGDTIQLELRPDEAMKAEKFPFDFVLTSTFRLDGKTLHHTLTVSNPGAEELRFGIGYHPAFQVPFDDNHTVEDYEFRFDQPESPVILDAQRGRPADGQMLLPVEEPAGHPADQRPLRQRQLLHGGPAHQDAGHLREGHGPQHRLRCGWLPLHPHLVGSVQAGALRLHRAVELAARLGERSAGVGAACCCGLPRPGWGVEHDPQHDLQPLNCKQKGGAPAGCLPLFVR